MTLPLPLTIDQTRLLAELHHLATLTDCPASTDASLPQPATAVTRLVFTARDLQARAWLTGLAEAAGFGVRVDAIGNTFIRWEGSDPSLPAVATGSHTDAIPYAGMYDGTVGVLGGLEAMRALQEAGFQPLRSLETVMLTSEEPTRFGIGCLGSRLIAGVLAPEPTDALPDLLPETDAAAPAGLRLREVREAAGLRGDLLSVRLPRDHYAAWVELHIEQGPLLEREGLPLGIVTGIAAPASYRYVIEGVGGHAGALLMPDRRDALCAAAELILAVERHTREANARAAQGGHSGVDTVATVGSLQVHPGAVNSVPSRVTLTLDIRDTDRSRRDAVMEALHTDIAAIEAARGVRITEFAINADPPTMSSPQILAALTEVCRAEGLPYKRMVSRAYHDSSFMAAVAPVAMIFIPCRGGVSHRPDEYSSPEAIALGTRVLALTLAKLAEA